MRLCKERLKPKKAESRRFGICCRCGCACDFLFNTLKNKKNELKSKRVNVYMMWILIRRSNVANFQAEFTLLSARSPLIRCAVCIVDFALAPLCKL